MLILAGGRAMPDGREEPKAQAPVGKRALGADCGAHSKRTLHGVGGASPKWLPGDCGIDHDSQISNAVRTISQWTLSKLSLSYAAEGSIQVGFGMDSKET